MNQKNQKSSHCQGEENSGQARGKLSERDREIERIAERLAANRASQEQELSEINDLDRAKEIYANPLRHWLFKLNVFSIIYHQKVAWGWLELLVVPLALAGGAFYLEQQAAERDLQLEESREHQAILNNYFSKMQSLIISNTGENIEEGSSEESVARAITAATIKSLDSRRNSLLINFLQEANLASRRRGERDGAKASSILRRLDIADAELEEVHLGGFNFSGSNLSGAKLSKANLSGADFAWATLDGADLSEAILSDIYLLGELEVVRANFWVPAGGFAIKIDEDYDDILYVSLREVDFSNSKMMLIDLGGSSLEEANFQGANLKGAYLGGDFTGATFKGNRLFGKQALLFGTNLSQASNLTSKQLTGWKRPLLCATLLPESIDLDPNRDCSGADLSYLGFTPTNFYISDENYGTKRQFRKRFENGFGRNLFKRKNPANLNRANLNSADISYVDLEKADLSDAILTNADLTSAVLIAANLRGANLDEAILEKTNLAGANLSSARNLALNQFMAEDGPILCGTTLPEDIASRVNANRDCNSISFESFDLSNSNFSNSNFQNVDFSKAKLQHVDFSSANLTGANLSDADLHYAYFNQTKLSGTQLRDPIGRIDGVIFLNVDLRSVQWLNTQQLSLIPPSLQPLFCGVALPTSLDINPNRDCDKIPQELSDRFDDISFSSAQEIVGDAKKKSLN